MPLIEDDCLDTAAGIAAGGSPDMLAPTDQIRPAVEAIVAEIADGESWGSGGSLPTQSGKAGKFLTTDGTTPSWGSGVRLLAQSGAPSVVGSTTSEVVLASFTLPANTMGPNDAIRITTAWAFTNSANNKNLKVKFGGTTYTSLTATTAYSASLLTLVANRNATNSQVSGRSNFGVDGASGGTLASSAVDTTVNVTVQITGQKDLASESLTLHYYSIELLAI
jgi:hypothetical protein